MRFACIERDNHALVPEIDFYIVHALNLHERPTELSDSAMMILAFGGDFDRFQDGVIGAFGIERVLWLELTWFRGVHHLLYAARDFDGCGGSSAPRSMLFTRRSRICFGIVRGAADPPAAPPNSS